MREVMLAEAGRGWPLDNAGRADPGRATVAEAGRRFDLSAFAGIE